MGPPKKLILSILPLGTAGTAAVPIFLPMISAFFHTSIDASHSIDFHSISRYSKCNNITRMQDAVHRCCLCTAVHYMR